MSTGLPRASSTSSVVALGGGLFGLLAVHVVGIILAVLSLALGDDAGVLVVPAILVAGWLVAAAALIALLVIAIREGLPRSTGRAALTFLVPLVALVTTIPWALSLGLGPLPFVGVAALVVLAGVASVVTSARPSAPGSDPVLLGNPILGGALWGFYGLLIAAAAALVLVTLTRIALDPAGWAIASQQVVDGSQLGFFRGRGGNLGDYVLLAPLLLATIAWLVFWPALTVTSPRHRTMKLAELQGRGRVRLVVLSIWSGGLLVLQLAIALSWESGAGDWLPAELTGLFLLHQIIAIPLLALSLLRASVTASRGPDVPLGPFRVTTSLVLGALAAVMIVLLLASPVLVAL